MASPGNRKGRSGNDSLGVYQIVDVVEWYLSWPWPGGSERGKCSNGSLVLLGGATAQNKYEHLGFLDSTFAPKCHTSVDMCICGVSQAATKWKLIDIFGQEQRMRGWEVEKIIWKIYTSILVGNCSDLSCTSLILIYGISPWALTIAT